MEFIPLQTHKNKLKKGKTIKEATPVKLKKNEKIDKKIQKIGKKKPQTKIIETKEVKSKRQERITKKKVLKKKLKNEEEDIEMDDQIKKQEEEEEEEEEGVEDNEEEDQISNEEEEDELKAFKKKCQEMDDRKKNRLFIKLKKRILSDGQIRELHPDIRSVIFPRKKKTRWCWAVFASEEKAKRALKKLKRNEDIVVNKPTPYDKVIKKRIEKKETVLRKKQSKKKLQKMWM